MADHPTSGTLADIESASTYHTDASWQPIRNHFGITAFGINAFTAQRAGERLIGEHDHAGPDDERHQELYFVHAGRAIFMIDGEEIDAPAGTFVSAREFATRRSATAAEPGTVVLVVGGEPGAAFAVTDAEREELLDAGITVRG